MARGTRSHARVETCEGPRATVKRGAHSVGQDLAILPVRAQAMPNSGLFQGLGTARDRPSPYGNPGRFFRSAGPVPATLSDL